MFMNISEIHIEMMFDSFTAPVFIYSTMSPHRSSVLELVEIFADDPGGSI
jgi:hypothetical protein